MPDTDTFLTIAEKMRIIQNSKETNAIFNLIDAIIIELHYNEEIQSLAKNCLPIIEKDLAEKCKEHNEEILPDFYGTALTEFLWKLCRMAYI